MKQLNKIVNGGNFTVGKAVLKYKDGSQATGLNFVDGFANAVRSHLMNDSDADFVQMGDNHYGIVTPKRENGIYFILIKLYKRNGSEFTFVKTFELSIGATLSSVRAEYISQNRLMIAYVGVSSNGKAVVFNFDPVAETGTFTGEYTFFASTVSGQIDIIKTEDNRCLIAYANNSGYLYGVIATYLAPDVIFGTSLLLQSHANAQMIRIANHDTGKFVIVCFNATTSQNVNAHHVSVNGSSVTSLNVLTLYSSVSTCYGLDIQVLDVNKLVVVMNHSGVNSGITTLVPLTINGSNVLAMGTVVNTGTGANGYAGLGAYDKTNKALYVLVNGNTLMKYNFNDTTNVFTEDATARLINLPRLANVNSNATANVSNNRYIPLSATQGIFFMPSDPYFSGGKFILFDNTKIDRPEIMGVAISQSEYVAEGLASGLTGLVAGKKYYVDGNGNLGGESIKDGTLPLPLALTVASSLDIEHAYVGVAISPTELVIPKRKKRTYVRSIKL